MEFSVNSTNITSKMNIPNACNTAIGEFEKEKLLHPCTFPRRTQQIRESKLQKKEDEFTADKIPYAF